MRDFESVLNFLDGLVYTQTNEHLNNLQRVILRECWQDSKQTYDRIAIKYDYSANYIKQGVGPKLWKIISQVTGEKVSKSNFQSVLERSITNNGIKFGSIGEFKVSNQIVKQHKLTVENVAYSSFDFPQPAKLEIPIDNVPLDSPFYIERVPHEAKCYQEIKYNGAFIRIKAPRQMGKSSLMHRILNYAKQEDFDTCMIHLQQAEEPILDNLNLLLRWFCANITRQLNLELKIDEYWDELLGAKMSCICYLQEYILSQLNSPLVIALEEVNEIIKYPQVAKEFLTLLRFWHERTKTNSIWQKLRLIMVHSTEIYIPLNINQSPLNIGLAIELQPFDLSQVKDLILRHNLTLDEELIDSLMNLLGGYPYLTRRALYHLARKDINLSELIETAPTDSGIYSNHLQRHLRNLESDPQLISALLLVINSKQPIVIEQIIGFKLHSMGLINYVGDRVEISCGLYQKYFSNRLKLYNSN